MLYASLPSLFIVHMAFIITAPFAHALHAFISVVQDSTITAVTAGVDSTACLAYSPIIAIVVSFLKRVPFVTKYPKWIAATLATAAVAVTVFATGDAMHTSAIVACVLKVFAGSIATYEVALKPVGKALGIRAS